jgi:hypothetical protein
MSEEEPHDGAVASLLDPHCKRESREWWQQVRRHCNGRGMYGHAIGRWILIHTVDAATSNEGLHGWSSRLLDSHCERESTREQQQSESEMELHERDSNDKPSTKSVVNRFNSVTQSMQQQRRLSNSGSCLLDSHCERESRERRHQTRRHCNGRDTQ